MLTDPDKRCSCGAGCATMGACLRGKNLNLGDLRGADAAHEYELKSYRDARAQGVQPKSTRLKDTREAMRISERHGRAFRP